MPLEEATEVITCQKCGKENQDHYKFCLGCGAELTRDAAKPEPAQEHFLDRSAPLAADATHASPGAQPAPAPLAASGGSPVAAGPAPVATGSSPKGAQQPPYQPAASNGAGQRCPQCTHHNATGNRFCAACGYKLDTASVPAKAVSAAPVGSGKVSLTALRADGSEAGSYVLQSSSSETVGRDTGSIFAGDSYLSPRHATFTRRGDGLTVSDAGSLNGVYLKILANAPWSLRFGDIFRIGQEILRLEKLDSPQASPDGVRRLGSPVEGYVARLGLVIGRDTTGNAFPVPRAGLHLGRERGDVLFPEDGYVSGLHCRLSVASEGTISLTDLGSSNGSFVRLKDEHPISSGDVLLMGQQLFRVDA